MDALEIHGLGHLIDAGHIHDDAARFKNETVATLDNALYQGIPIGGYTKMVEYMLDGINVRLDTDYL